MKYNNMDQTDKTLVNTYRPMIVIKITTVMRGNVSGQRMCSDNLTATLYTEPQCYKENVHLPKRNDFILS